MDVIHSSGVLVIQHLQTNYGDYQDFLNFMSSVGDPRNIFTVYFPVWFHLNQNMGTKMIWAAVIGDWLNLIFKWILFGQRPYWWVQETQLYLNRSLPQLEQFHTTCETGPGSPSGHAMGSSCAWYVMVVSTLSFFRASPAAPCAQSLQSTRLLRSCLWMTFWLVQISVCTSRVFIATHFPHQVILGLFSGMLVAKAFDHAHFIYTASFKVYLQISLFLSSLAACFYLLLRSAATDPLWSVAKARKWCAKSEWIDIDTAPFAGLVRALGALVGLGLAVNSQPFVQSCRGKSDCKTRLVCVTASLTSLQLYDFVKLPAHTEVVFYILSFMKSASVPLCVVTVVPYCVHMLVGKEDRKLF